MKHIPVLHQAFVEAMLVNPAGQYLDCTFGRGGHSKLLLQHLHPNGQLLAIDRDPGAISAGDQLAASEPRFHILHYEFAELDQALQAQGWGFVDGIGFDLGVSSPQFDTAERGFSFQHDGPLDMRMDTEHGTPLSDLLERVSEKKLIDVLRDFGNERFASRIAKAMLKAWHQGGLRSTRDLENICFHAVPKQARYGSTHPATRTFQALRIWVNDELEQIRLGIEAAIQHLKPGGRLVVISFHSGEDRLVRDLIEAHVNPCTCPREFPMCVCGKHADMRWVAKKPIRPSEHEVESNPRSRSSLMRVAEKLPESDHGQ